MFLFVYSFVVEISSLCNSSCLQLSVQPRLSQPSHLSPPPPGQGSQVVTPQPGTLQFLVHSEVLMPTFIKLLKEEMVKFEHLRDFSSKLRYKMSDPK